MTTFYMGFDGSEVANEANVGTINTPTNGAVGDYGEDSEVVSSFHLWHRDSVCSQTLNSRFSNVSSPLSVSMGQRFPAVVVVAFVLGGFEHILESLLCPSGDLVA